MGGASTSFIIRQTIFQHVICSAGTAVADAGAAVANAAEASNSDAKAGSVASLASDHKLPAHERQGHGPPSTSRTCHETPLMSDSFPGFRAQGSGASTGGPAAVPFAGFPPSGPARPSTGSTLQEGGTPGSGPSFRDPYGGQSPLGGSNPFGSSPHADGGRLPGPLGKPPPPPHHTDGVPDYHLIPPHSMQSPGPLGKPPPAPHHTEHKRLSVPGVPAGILPCTGRGASAIPKSDSAHSFLNLLTPVATSSPWDGSTAGGQTTASAIAAPLMTEDQSAQVDDAWYRWLMPYAQRIHLPAHYFEDIGPSSTAARLATAAMAAGAPGGAQANPKGKGTGVEDANIGLGDMEGLLRGEWELAALRFGPRRSHVSSEPCSSYLYPSYSYTLLPGRMRLVLSEEDPDAPKKSQDQLQAMALRTMGMALPYWRRGSSTLECTGPCLRALQCIPVSFQHLRRRSHSTV
eukprot:gene19894-26597_t